MKKLFLTLGLVVCSALQTFAQGQFSFSNSGTTSYISIPGNAKDITFSFDYIYAKQPNVTDPSQLTLSLATPKTGLSGGFFLGGTQIIPGYVGTISLQVRCWQTSAGSYQNAIATGSYAGCSAIANVPLTDSSASPVPAPTSLNGIITSFHVTNPEPSTFALGAFGMAVLFFARRK